MRILFVENQYKTYFFEAIALRLQEQGHEINWIVQNKVFTPKTNFKKYIIPYPRKKDYTNLIKSDLKSVIESDRNVNYFKSNNNKYFYYYYNKIKEVIDEVKPGVVFGESAVFHELLIGKYCKELNIKYLNPLPCRYPTGKFSFYLYNTPEPYRGCATDLPKEVVVEIINNIVNRRISPDYMKPLELNLLEKIANKFKKTHGFFIGEKFNTPSPRIKLNVEKEKQINKNIWDEFSLDDVIEDNNFKILYPLQVQPEENIDVWGRKRRNQLLVIKEIVENLPKNSILYVKPNPKPKYEVDSKMIAYVNKHDRIRVLKHTVSMTSVFNKFDLIVTVTGTIAIESILSNMPVINLVKTLNNTINNCVYLDDLEVLPEIVKQVKENRFPKATEEEKIEFINLLNRTSYTGNVSDVLSDKNCINEDNITIITEGFNDVINHLNNDK